MDLTVYTEYFKLILSYEVTDPTLRTWKDFTIFSSKSRVELTQGSAVLLGQLLLESWPWPFSDPHTLLSQLFWPPGHIYSQPSLVPVLSPVMVSKDSLLPCMNTRTKDSSIKRNRSLLIPVWAIRGQRRTAGSKCSGGISVDKSRFQTLLRAAPRIWAGASLHTCLWGYCHKPGSGKCPTEPTPTELQRAKGRGCLRIHLLFLQRWS